MQTDERQPISVSLRGEAVKPFPYDPDLADICPFGLNISCTQFISELLLLGYLSLQHAIPGPGRASSPHQGLSPVNMLASELLELVCGVAYFFREHCNVDVNSIVYSTITIRTKLILDTVALETNSNETEYLRKSGHTSRFCRKCGFWLHIQNLSIPSSNLYNL